MGSEHSIVSITKVDTMTGKSDSTMEPTNATRDLPLELPIQSPKKRSLLEVEELEKEYSETYNPSFDEVKNLLWIAENPVYKTALEDWEHKSFELMRSVDMADKQSGDLKNEIYQLVGYFAVLQGVVLTAVTQMMQSGTACKKVWGPTLLTSVALLVTCLGVFLKLMPMYDLEKRRTSEHRVLKDVIHRTQTLRFRGPAFRFGMIAELFITPFPEPCNWITLKFLPIVVTLTTFTGIFIALYFLVLCDRGLAST